MTDILSTAKSKVRQVAAEHCVELMQNLGFFFHEPKAVESAIVKLIEDNAGKEA